MSSLQVITAPAKEWIAALNRLTPATIGKKAVPILGMVRIDPVVPSLFAVGNTGTAEADLISDPGTGDPFLVSYAWLRSAITSTTGRDRSADVKVALDAKQVTVEALGYKLRVETAPISEFPEQVTHHVFESHIAVDAEALRTALGRALVAASTDDTLPTISSVRFKSSPEGLTLWSTDRYRLTSGFVPGHGYGSESFTVPLSMLKHMAKQVKKGSVHVDLAKVGNVVFRLPNATYTAAGIEADYPKLGELFEITPTTVMDVDRVQLLEAAKVAHHMSERNTPAYLTISEAGVLTSFNDGVFGPDSAPLAKGTLTGEPVRLAFNSFYFLGLMNSFKGEKVRIYGGSPGKKWHFIDGGADTKDATLYRHILMPVRMPHQ
ncbi:DNA polymerase III subunit beta [Arthrobacter sp. GMC3]|uniref:DNA polymerase III subunit beta n=1 Tax=Arthrobacter sp. GMC3 TaxID=2058894 RepID=UPI000CE32882|nr:DNA polymerase III subunit beta [Arthrobacter sp. GMC3]